MCGSENSVCSSRERNLCKDYIVYLLLLLREILVEVQCCPHIDISSKYSNKTCIRSMLAHQSRARRAFINNLETERRVHVDEAMYKQRELDKKTGKMPKIGKETNPSIPNEVKADDTAKSKRKRVKNSSKKVQKEKNTFVKPTI